MCKESATKNVYELRNASENVLCSDIYKLHFQNQFFCIKGQKMFKTVILVDHGHLL